MGELLLNFKADIIANNNKNQTPPHNAAKYIKKAMVQLLIKYETDIDARDED